MPTETEVAQISEAPQGISDTTSDSDHQNLTEQQLKAAITAAWSKHEQPAKAELAPLLYWLRKKMRAQGARNDKSDKPEGFGIWCEEHLHITRRTADRWADDWAIEQGLKKPAKRTLKTFGKTSKGDKGNPAADGRVVVIYQMTLTEEENEKWLAALRVLGPAAEKLVFETVLTAAHVPVPKKPAASEIEANPEQAKAKGARQ